MHFVLDMGENPREKQQFKLHSHALEWQQNVEQIGFECFQPKTKKTQNNNNKLLGGLLLDTMCKQQHKMTFDIFSVCLQSVLEGVWCAHRKLCFQNAQPFIIFIKFLHINCRQIKIFWSISIRYWGYLPTNIHIDSSHSSCNSLEIICIFPCVLGSLWPQRNYFNFSLFCEIHLVALAIVARLNEKSTSKYDMTNARQRQKWNINK